LPTRRGSCNDDPMPVRNTAMPAPPERDGRGDQVDVRINRPRDDADYEHSGDAEGEEEGEDPSDPGLERRERAAINSTAGCGNA